MLKFESNPEYGRIKRIDSADLSTKVLHIDLQSNKILVSTRFRNVPSSAKDSLIRCIQVDA